MNPQANGGPGGPGGQPPGERPQGPLIGERPGPYRRHSGQIAAVLLYGNGGHSVLWPDRTEHHNKPFLGSAYTAIEVRLGRYVTDFELTLPAAGDDQFFAARVRLEWEVEDPFAVVTKNVTDIRYLLEGELLDALRPLSRRFRPTEAQRVDEAVQDERRSGRLELGRELGLRTTIRVFIDLSEEVGTEVGEDKSFRRQASRRTQEVQVQRQVEAEERKLFEDRARHLERVLRQGQEAEIVYHMAKNPEKEWEIRQAVRREQREEKADFLNLFNRLLDTGILERHDIGEQTYEVLQYLRDSTNKVLPENPRRPLPAPERHRAPRQIEDRRREPEPDLPPWERADDPSGTGDPSGAAGPAPTADSSDPWDDPDDSWGAPDDQPPARVHEPTRVDPGSERAHRSRTRSSRPSSAFDDWGDE